MTENKPFFSVIIPSYNRAAMIGDTLNCFLAQTFSNFELIVVDDGSTDSTDTVMKDWLERDVRIRYYKKENGERGAARNYGVRQANGLYITFIDSDDGAYPFALQTAFDMIHGQQEMPPCIALRYEVRDKATGKETLPPPSFGEATANEALRKSNVLGCIGVFLKKEIALAIPFNEDRKFAGTEDWLLWLRIAARYPILYNQRICYCIYQHDDRSVMNFPEDKLLYRAEHLRAYLLEDESAVAAYGISGINAVYAHMLTYASLHLAMSRKKLRALYYLGKGIRVKAGEVFTRRFIGILKNIILR